MYNVYFDSGTSNTRAYLIKDYTAMDAVKRNIGSKDVSIARDHTVLIEGLKELYDQLLRKNELTDTDVRGIYASGMVTGPFGIKEVPHVSTPVSLKKLCDSIYTHYESGVFKRNIYLIRGAKTVAEDYRVNSKNIADVNNVRGEEIELFGLLAKLPEDLINASLAVFFPGSHTHIAYVKQGVLQDILSTFSGELFYAISSGTILSSSIESESGSLDEEMIRYGFRRLKEYGINRALYIAHAMKVFDVSDNLRIKSYLCGIVNGSTVAAFEKVMAEKWKEVDSIIVAGSNEMIGINEILLKEAIKNVEIMTIFASEKDSLAVKGFLEILKQR